MAQPAAPPQYLTPAEVGRLLHMSARAVSRRAAAGKIPFVRTLGGHRRYDPVLIASLAERLSTHESNGGEA